MLRITINGTEYAFKNAIRIIDALVLNGITIPALCDDERLSPIGACRTCIVEVQGMHRPITACNNAIHDGMVIETHSKKIENLRRTLLQMLARNYPKDAIQREPYHIFHQVLAEYKVSPETSLIRDPIVQEQGLVMSSSTTSSIKIDRSHPYIQVDMSRCITCFRCVRICDDVQGQFVWQVWNRGDRTRILPDSLGDFGDSTCTSCGACADSCPSGAIMDNSVALSGMPERWTKTVCAYCGVGCELLAGTKNGVIVNIRPAKDAPVNKGHLCSKGRYAHGYVHASDRLKKPLIRENGRWKEASFDAAFDYVVEKLQAIKNQHGADAIGVLGSARATNEENYLIQKFARVVLETNNVDCCARVCHTPSAAALKLMLGSGAATNSFADIERAQTIMICGTNTTENHPVIGARVKQAVLNGANLIVIDPRKIELANYASVHLALRPGTNILLFNAMACAIIEEGLIDEEFIADCVLKFDDFKRFIIDFSPEKVSSICGVDSQSIRRAACIYASAKPSIILNGLGITEFVQGTKSVMSLINLALITGNLKKPGSGINPMRGQNNVQGAALMGCDPNSLVGGISIKDGLEHCEKIWRTSLPKTHGLNLLRMLDNAISRRLQALYIVGYDILLSNPNVHASRMAFSNLGFVVVQDLFMTKTASEFGHVILPVCSSFEKSGTFMNAERRIQLVRKVIDPLPGTKTDAEIIIELAKRMGKDADFAFHSSEDVWNEIRTLWPDSAGITYERLENSGIQWPCRTLDHPGTEILHQDQFVVGKKATLKKITFTPSPEQIDETYPLLLITGRNLYQFNAGTMSGRTPNLIIRPTDTLDINPKDANSLQFSSNEIVKVKSRYGEALLPIKINENTKPGELFCTFSTPDLSVNCLTGPHRDSIVDTPEYKITAVKLEKLN